MGWGSPPPTVYVQPPRPVYRRRPAVVVRPPRPLPPQWYSHYPGRLVWHGGMWVWRRMHPRRGWGYYRQGGRWFRRRYRNRSRVWRSRGWRRRRLRRARERIGGEFDDDDDGGDGDGDSGGGDEDYEGEAQSLDDVEGEEE